MLISGVNQNGGILTYFDEPKKIKDLTKSKAFAANYSTKKLYNFSEKNGVGALLNFTARQTQGGAPL